ncbi:hypothetical protein EVAR_40296_1, partial [Eumeta japonica]
SRKHPCKKVTSGDVIPKAVDDPFVLWSSDSSFHAASTCINLDFSRGPFRGKSGRRTIKVSPTNPEEIFRKRDWINDHNIDKFVEPNTRHLLHLIRDLLEFPFQKLLKTETAIINRHLNRDLATSGSRKLGKTFAGTWNLLPAIAREQDSASNVQIDKFVGTRNYNVRADFQNFPLSNHEKLRKLTECQGRAEICQICVKPHHWAGRARYHSVWALELQPHIDFDPATSDPDTNRRKQHSI